MRDAAEQIAVMLLTHCPPSHTLSSPAKAEVRRGNQPAKDHDTVENIRFILGPALSSKFMKHSQDGRIPASVPSENIGGL